MPIDQKLVEAEIRAGLPNERERLQDAYDSFRYSQGRFEEYPTKGRDGPWRSDSPRRTSPVMQRAMIVLTDALYRNQPTRKLADAKASETLGQWYKAGRIGPKLKRAEQLALVGGFSAIRWTGTDDPANPVKATLWGAHEIVVWTDPDDSTTPAAVAVIDRYDSSRRLRLYTADEVVTYQSGKGADHVAFGAGSYLFGGRSPAPRFLPLDGFKETGRRPGRGFLPFAFFHWWEPTQEFTTNGPGDTLRTLNESVNDRLDRLGDSIHYLGRPILTAAGLDENVAPPAELKPGDIWHLVGAKGPGAPPPTLQFLMPDVGYVAADWADLNNYLDHSLEMHGVPPVLVRMIESGARSGASIEAEQAPLLRWVEGRRASWSAYEEDLAKVCLTTAAAHLQANGRAADARSLAKALDAWNFTIRWPSLYVERPGPERDQADDRRLLAGLVSKVGLLMERDGLTEAEAFEALEKVKDQNDRIRALGIDPGDKAPNPFGASFGGEDDPTADDAPADEDPAPGDEETEDAPDAPPQ